MYLKRDLVLVDHNVTMSQFIKCSTPLPSNAMLFWSESRDRQSDQHPMSIVLTVMVSFPF